MIEKVENIIRKYELLNKNEKVIVALSGGKDSTSVLYILYKLGYRVEGLMIDLKLGKWSERHLENMKKFCSQLGINLTIIDLRRELGAGICFIKQAVKEKKNLSGCSICGVIKKYLLNKKARQLRADKLVTGHNLDDECQTVLMNFLKGNVMLAGFGPKIEVENEKFVQRIKPLFFIPENEIRKYAKKMKFKISYEKCPCAFGTYRTETRKWMGNFSDEEKMEIVRGWLKIAGSLRRNNKINYCEICEEPTRNQICKACEIFGCLKERHIE